MIIPAVTLVVLTFIPTITTAQCSCTGVKQLFDFITNDIREMPRKNEFPWKFISCQGDVVTIELVFTDNPLHDSYALTLNGNETIFYNGAWTPFEDFVDLVIPQCKV